MLIFKNYEDVYNFIKIKKCNVMEIYQTDEVA